MRMDSCFTVNDRSSFQKLLYNSNPVKLCSMIEHSYKYQQRDDAFRGLNTE